MVVRAGVSSRMSTPSSLPSACRVYVSSLFSSVMLRLRSAAKACVSDQGFVGSGCRRDDPDWGRMDGSSGQLRSRTAGGHCKNGPSGR